jgi:hypothetical protein
LNWKEIDTKISIEFLDKVKEWEFEKWG